MAKRNSNAQSPEATSATVGYEAQLWQMADALRGSMDAAKYKHVVLGLIFLISDALEEQHAKLVADKTSDADAEILTSAARCRSSGWHRKLGGSISKRKPVTARSATSWTMRWLASSDTTGRPPKDHARPAFDKTPIPSVKLG